MNKSLVIAGTVLVAMLPWWSGGRESAAFLITAFAVLIGSLLLWRQPGPAKTVASWPLRWVAAAITLWAGLGLIWSVNRFSTEMWLAYWALAVLVFILAANLNLQTKKRLLNGYLWLAAAASAYGIYTYLTGSYDRLTSGFYWANPAAAYLLPAAVIGAWEWVRERRLKILVPTATVLTGFWLTDSRGAFLVLGLLTAIAMAAPAFRRKVLLAGSLAAATFVLALGFNWLRSHQFNQPSLAPGSRFAEAAQGESSSVRDRLGYISSSLKIWLQYPAGGTGPGTFGTVHPQYQSKVTQASSDAHNFYIQTLAEQGLIGFMLLLWLVCLLLIGMWRGAARQPEMAAAGVAAVGLGLHFGLDIDARYPALIVLLAALTGAVYQPLLRRTVDYRRAGIMPVLLTVLLIVSLSAYQSSVWAAKGAAAQQSRDYEAAAAEYEKAHGNLVYDPDYLTAEGINYYTLASVTGGSKSYESLALDRAERAIKSDPRDSQHYFLKARVERLGGRLAAAESDYRQALKLDRFNHPQYYADLASLQLQLGRENDAAGTATQGISLYPQKVIDNRSYDRQVPGAVSQLYTIRAAIKLKNNQDASGDINQALKLFPLNREAQQLRSDALRR